jgi:hypothetical protein
VVSGTTTEGPDDVDEVADDDGGAQGGEPSASPEPAMTEE